MTPTRRQFRIANLALLAAAAGVGIGVWLQGTVTATAQTPPKTPATAATPVWGEQPKATQPAQPQNPAGGKPIVPQASLPSFGQSAPAGTQSASNPAAGVKVPAGLPWKSTSATPFSEKPFVMSLAQDKADGIWVGTEGEGIWKYEGSAPAEQRWRRYTTSDGLGDDYAYAMACDRLGRIWVGHLNHGVSVFNGQKWQNYEVVGGLSRPDTLSGPLGERIFAMLVCPTDGDVWMASSAGLARYSEKKDDWTYYTRAEGLPSDQANAIAFDKDGDIYVGTQCDGIAVAKAADNYQKWRTVKGPDAMPTDAAGEGLPTNLINDLLVAQDGTIYAATTTGLAWSTDRAVTFHYARGKDWADKAKGLVDGPPKGWAEAGVTPNAGATLPWAGTQPAIRTTQPTGTAKLPWAGSPSATPTTQPTPTTQMPWTKTSATQPASNIHTAPPSPLSLHLPLGAFLAEDYITCLAEEPGTGKLWIGYRQQGCESYDVHTGKVQQVKATKAYVIRMLPINNDVHDVVIGTYGDGQLKTPQPAKDMASLPLDMSRTVISMPAGASVPSEADIRRLLEHVSNSVTNAPKNLATIEYLTPDWSTQGLWLGRYGKYWMAHAAAVAPFDLIWGAEAAKVQYDVSLGFGAIKGDSLRYWISANHTQDPRALELPMPYLQSRVEKGLTTWGIDRRQSEWDDHGEVTSPNRTGPGINLSLRIPEGLFCLSIYNVNENGHAGNERLRDYLLSVREHPENRPLGDCRGFEDWNELARARVEQQWGGVYTRFLIHGPQMITVHIDRNYSFNTNLNAVFLDSFEEHPADYVGGATDQLQHSFRNANLDLDQSMKLVSECLASMDALMPNNSRAFANCSRPAYAELSRYLSSHNFNSLSAKANTATALYRLGTYSKWEQLERELDIRTPRDIEKALKWDHQSEEMYPEMNRDLIKMVVDQAKPLPISPNQKEKHI